MKDLAELQTKTFRIYSADSGNLLLRIPCIFSANPRREERLKKSGIGDWIRMSLYEESRQLGIRWKQIVLRDSLRQKVELRWADGIKEKLTASPSGFQFSGLQIGVNFFVKKNIGSVVKRR